MYSSYFHKSMKGLFLNFICQIWMKSDRPSPSPLGGTVRALLQAGFCMGTHIYLAPQYPLSRFTDQMYKDWGFMERLIYQYMCSFTARWKYYFIWSISEASMILSGLGFSGWTNRSPQKARWERAKNVDILGVEFAKSSVEIPLVWNIHVSTWLRHCESSLLASHLLFIYLLTVPLRANR